MGSFWQLALLGCLLRACVAAHLYMEDLQEQKKQTEHIEEESLPQSGSYRSGSNPVWQSNSLTDSFANAKDIQTEVVVPSWLEPGGVGLLLGLGIGIGIGIGLTCLYLKIRNQQQGNHGMNYTRLSGTRENVREGDGKKEGAGESAKQWSGEGEVADLPDVRLLEVLINLDMNTINPYLIVSEDGRSVRWTEQRQNLIDIPEKFDEYPCVLGNRLPAELRRGCYWEVEVGNKKSWELGVARDSVSRKGQLSLSPGAGFWVLSLWDGKLMALTDPETRLDTGVLTRVGIYLDYENKKVRFYNVDKDSNKSEKKRLIYFFDEEIDRTVRPFFSPGNSDQDPLIISPNARMP
nr:PREDICTED: zinc finger protein RFP-like isoform X2 [Lepisosteus oculatus]